MTVDFRLPDEAALLEFFAYLFPRDKETGCYKVSGTNDVGRLLIAYARTTDKPAAEAPSGTGHPVRLELPLSHLTQSLSGKWLYYSAPDTLRIIAALRAVFNIDFRSYYLAGLSRDYGKKETIEMYIVSRGFVRADPYEALHKRVYRAEQKRMSRLTAQLLRKARYFEESLDLSEMPQ